MYRILTASKDTYITNKIINSSFRATDANVGRASTLDLFKLYSESTLSGTENPVEISRALVKFDLNPIRQMTSSFLDIGSNSFSVTMRLSDVYGGQTTPSNFKMIVFPLSKSFDEGIGRNIVNYSDLDSTNYITASVSSGSPILWSKAGATASGSLGEENIDVIVSGNLNDGSGNRALCVEKVFATGEEDLVVDITAAVSGVLAGQIPDHGFLIAYSGSYEKDEKTYFVKRFASLQSDNYIKKPAIIVKFNDCIQDHHRTFFFDTTGSLFLNNSKNSGLSNLVSGVAGSAITGSNCIYLRLMSGSQASGSYFRKTITGSQHKFGTTYVTGVYSASFAVSEFETSEMFDHVKNAHSASFKTVWFPEDESFAFLSGSLTINRPTRTSFDNDLSRILVKVTNLKPVYRRSDKARFRIFAEDIDREIVFKRLPMEKKSQIFTKMYYRIRDVISGDIVVPFEKTDGATLCSTDSNGMYFDLYMDTLSLGRVYTIDFEIVENGISQIFEDVAAKFRVEE